MGKERESIHIHTPTCGPIQLFSRGSTCGGRYQCVIPYGTRVPVAVRHSSNCYTRLLTLLYFTHKKQLSTATNNL